MDKNSYQDVNMPDEVVKFFTSILKAIDQSVRDEFGDSVLIKMVAFIIESMYNPDIANATTVKERFDKINRIFDKKFHSILVKHDVVTPIFLNYLIDKMEYVAKSDL